MARKSRIAENAMSIISAKEGAYKTAVYARLSTEDLDEDTLDNQIYLLKSFVGEKTDMVLVDIYADNGFSGTNFERPEFTRLMNDVKTGKVNCIVVKDLSRLGRNYIETGNLIENVFPFLNVRFIAVTDNFDTNEGGGVENMVASFKNLVNDVYAKDISRKIITAFRTKQKNGEYIGLVAPYGYLKSAENKNKFVIDEKTAPAVKKIFELYAGGYGLDRMVQIERAIRQTNSKIADLYKDVSDGLIDENDYLLMKTKFLNDKKQFEREEKLLSDNMKKNSDSAGKLRAADYLKKCKKAKKLDRKMVESFIELVTINDDKSIEITFSCCDEILRKLEG